MSGSRAPGRLLSIGLALLRLPFSWWRKKPLAPKRILILHHLLLGDTIMVTPLIAKLREQFPHADIQMAMPRGFVSLYQRRPYGLTALPFDPRDVKTILALLRQPAPDWVLLPADNRYSWLARALGARWIVGFAGDKPNWKNWFVDDLRPYSTTPTAWGDTCAELIDGPRPAGFKLQDWPAPEAEVSKPAGRYAVLHLGASTALKHWPPERWTALAQHLHQQGILPVWSAGANETALVQAADPAGQFPSMAGQLNLPQLWRLLHGATLLVCPDTGIAHMGRVVGAPTVALFGPGSALMCGAGEFWRHSPYRAVTVEDFACRDQSINYLRIIDWVRRCERFPGDAPHQCAQARCMNAIELSQVEQVIQHLLSLPTTPHA